MTETPPTGIKEYLDYCVDKYFKPLIVKYEMVNTTRHSSEWGATFETMADELKIRLVNDRGLISFEVSSSYEDDKFWDVELVYELFHCGDKKQMKGIKRLSLEQQVELIDNNWRQLQSLFGKANLEKTFKLLNELDRQRTKATLTQ